MSGIRKLILFICIVLPVVLVALYSYSRIRKNATERLYEERKSIASLSARVLKEKFDRLSDLGLSISTGASFRKAVDEENWIEAVKLVDQISTDFPYIFRLFLTDTTGTLMADVPHAPEVLGKNFANRNWYNEFKKTGKPHLSEVYITDASPHRLVTSMAVPVKNDSGQTRGILVLQVTVTVLLQWSKEVNVGNSGFLYVIDQKGHIAANPEYSEKDSLVDYSFVPAVQKALSGKKGVGIFYNPIASESRLIAYEQIPGYGWAVIVQQEEKAALSAATTSKSIVLIYIFAILLACGFAFFIIRFITKIKKADERLEEFGHFFNNNNDLCGIANTVGFFETINSNFIKILGYSEKEFCKTPFIELIHPDDVASTLHEYEKLKAGEIIINFLNRYRKKDGSYLYLDWNATPNPLTGKLYCVARDVTGRKKIEEKLKESEHMFSELFFKSPVMKAITDATTGNFLQVNEAFAHFFEKSSAEILGKKSVDIGLILKPEENKRLLKQLQINKTVRDLEVQINIGDKIRWISINSDSVKLRGKDCFLLAVTDITYRKEVQLALTNLNADLEERVAQRSQELAKSEAFNRGVINALSAHVAVIDESGKLVSTNDNWIQFGMENGATTLERIGLGANYYEVCERSILAGDTFAEEALNGIKSVMVGKNQIFILEYPCHSPNQKRWFHMRVTQFKQDQAMVVITHSDVTERKISENALVQSEARARRLFESDLIGFIFWSNKGEILEANDHFLSMTGYTRYDLENGLVSWAAMTPPEYADRDVIALEQIASTGYCKPFEKEYIRKDGSRFPISLGATSLGDSFNGIGVCYVMDISERKKAEEKLVVSEKRFRALIENNHDIVSILNEKFELIYRSPSAERITGWNDVDREHKNSIDQMHPDDVEMSKRIMQQVLQHPAKSFSMALRIRHKNGHYIWIEGIAMNMLHDPSVGGIITNFRDVTDRKKAEEEITLLNQSLEKKVDERTSQLKESEAQIQTIFKYAPDAVVVIDEEGIIVKWNPRAEVIFGWQSVEVIGKHLHEIIIPHQFREAHVKGMNHFLKTGEGQVLNRQLELPALRKDNTAFDAGISISPTRVNGKYVFIGFISDITERKKAEGALNKLNAELEQRVNDRTAEVVKSEKRFKALIENNHDIIALLNEKFEPIYRSPSAVHYTGWTEEERKHLNTIEQTHPDDVELRNLVRQQVLQNPAKPFSIVLRIRHKNGHYVWMEGTIMNMLHDSSVGGIITNFRDVTDRKQAEEEIFLLNQNLEKKVEERTGQWQAANKELEAFSYSVSHDLRAPLRSIDGYARILEEDYKDKLDDEGKRVVDTITRNANRMGRLIDDMLNLSKVGRLAISPALINMNDVVNKIITELQEAEARFNVEFNIGDLAPARADLDMIIQVWTNYIGNAIKYSSKKTSPLVEIGSHTEGNEIVYYVKDNGSGFDSQYIHKLFGVFQRLHRHNEFDGTGVGLAIVKRIIEKHNGRVWAEGMPNRGATFYFTIPLKPNSNE